MIAYAFKDDAVIACILQFWPEMSAGIGSAYGSGKRRFATTSKRPLQDAAVPVSGLS